MWLAKLAWKNLWRNRSRTLITTSAVAFATLISVISASLKEGVFNNLVRNIVSAYTGHLQVHRKGYQDEQILDNSFPQSRETMAILRSAGGLAHAAPRLEAFALASSGNKTKGCMVLGIDPAAEQQITGWDQRISEGRYIDGKQEAVMMGERLAARLDIRLGDTVILIGQGYHGSTAAGKYRVGALLRLGSPQLNERLLVMPLPMAQQFLSADSLLTSMVAVMREGEDMDEAAAQLRSRMGSQFETLTWEQIMPEVKQHIETDTRNMRVVQWILYVLISFGIFSTLLIMMVERRFETGMLLALGMSKPRIQLLMILESLMTVMLGSVAGITLSVPVVWYLHARPIRITGEAASAYERFGFEPIFPAAMDPMLFVEQGLVVFLIGLLLSMYPVYKIARMDAVKAMKT